MEKIKRFRRPFMIALKIIAVAALLYMLFIFVLPMSAGICNVGNIFGAGAAVILLIPLVFWEKLRGFFSHGAGKIVFALFLSALFICMIIACYLSFIMLKAAYNTPQNPTAMIILGCKVNGDTPSLMLQRRIDAAADYLLENNEVIAVCSGGQGPDEIMPEGNAIADSLIDAGIDENRIIIEDPSTNTEENLKYSAKMLKDLGLDGETIIVTDGFHQYRASLLAKREGIAPSAVSADTPVWLLPTYIVREWLGILYYHVLG